MFARTRKIVLLVTGESKRAVINTLLTKPETIPAGIALSHHSSAELWTDLTL
jgi:6-phosphogluconolactonase/glucosamine-6-phosphate isomerase/deaminase